MSNNEYLLCSVRSASNPAPYSRNAGWLLTAALLLTFSAPPVLAQLTDYEVDQIQFMKEEEKLARDVYTALGENWDLAVFGNIARSEQNHMNQMDTLLNTFGLPDPASPLPGVFNNPVLQHLYDRLTATGSTSLRAALGVGELIEVVDIDDLSDLIDAAQQPSIVSTAERLRSASYNHLAAFRNQLALLPELDRTSSSTLFNLSARAVLGTGEDSLITGFVVRGETPLQVLLLVRGPSIAPFGIEDPALDPALSLYHEETLIAENDQWGTAVTAETLSAHGIYPLAPNDAAVLLDLAPGIYTVIAHNHSSGAIGLSEIYGFPTENQTSSLANLSVRARTAPGDDRLIAGFMVRGEEPLPLLVRALSPTLLDYGVVDTVDRLEMETHVGDAPAVTLSDWLGPNVLGSVPSLFWPGTLLEPMDIIQPVAGAVTLHALAPGDESGIVLLDVTIL